MAHALREEDLDVIAEVEAREGLRARLLDPSFPKQTAFILDKSPRSAALCTRRAGKSWGIGAAFFEDSLDYPGANYLYLALTRMSAKNIMWRDILKTMNAKYEIKAHPNEAELTLTLETGGVIQLAGADATKEEMEKYLGGKYRGIVIDETGSFRQDVEKLVIENLEPALADWGGWLKLIGTPTALTESFFHKVTEGKVGGWNIHRWNTFDNPHMRDKWAKQVARLKETYGEALDLLPWYRRMYLGEWVTDHEALVYKYDERRNASDELPAGRYTYVLGVDLGFDDPTAFCLLAYNSHQKTSYVVEAYKRSGMLVSDIEQRIKHYQSRYPIYEIVIDNASKQFVEELKDRTGLAFEAAEKQGKAEIIEILNSEMLQGKIKLLPDTEPLKKELTSLIWDESKKPKREEHPRCENHCADAFLYAWRKSMAYMSVAPPKEPETDEERVDEWEEKEATRLAWEQQAEWWDY
jgi:PBSX family phage terminase large subunit